VFHPVDGLAVEGSLNGYVRHGVAVRAHGVNDTSADPKVRTPLGSKSGLTVTSPVNVSAGPGPAGRTLFGEISMVAPVVLDSSAPADAA
jgi:hypothetical protein